MNSSLRAEISDLKSNLQPGISNVTMEYLSLAGRRFGGIREWETRLTLLQDGATELFRRRGPGDSPHKPPGCFQGRVTDTKIIEFLDALAESGIEEYQSDLPGPTDPINFLRINLGGTLHSFSWGASITPMPEAMARLKRLLTDWVVNACHTPLWNLYLTVDSLDFHGGALKGRLRVENRGTQPIHIVHPASPGFGPVFGLRLAYGEAQLIQAGVTPDLVEEREAPIAVEVLPAPKLIRITSNGSFPIDFSAVLEGEAPRGWVGAFAFHHYLPGDRLAGISVFNGALFSEDLQW